METWREGLRVDLIAEDAQSERLIDSLIEADEKLQQALTTTTHQHGIGAVFVGGSRDTTESHSAVQQMWGEPTS